jgi:hypothetical protein
LTRAVGGIGTFVQKSPDDLKMSVLNGFDEGRNAGVIFDLNIHEGSVLQKLVYISELTLRAGLPQNRYHLSLRAEKKVMKKQKPGKITQRTNKGEGS